MKKLLYILLILCMLALVGCEKLIDLKPEEEDQIAQGVSWLLLKRDKGYIQKLVTPTPTPTPRPTMTPTLTPTPKVKPTSTPGAGGKDNPTGGPKQNEKAFAELKEVIGIDEISLEFGGYDLYDNYTLGSASIEPSGTSKQLMIAKIIIHNNGKAPVALDLFDLKLDISLDIGEKSYLQPMLSLISNDFGLLKTTIAAGESFESVIVFEVKKNFNPEKLNMFITKDDKTVIIKLK